MRSFVKEKLNESRIKFLSSICTINKSPIIVLGNQKTGTSVISHLLADYGGLSKTIDIPEIVSPTIDKLIKGNISIENFAKKYAFRFSKDLIKEPNLTFLFDQVNNLHPLAKYVFIIRDPRNNIRSILDRLSLPGNLHQLENPHTIHPSWKNIFDSHLWDIPKGSYIETLAHRWVKASEVYEKNKERMILVRYEDFTNDKFETIRQLADNLKINKMYEIADKLNVQYQPKGKKNIEWKEFFGIENLIKIEQICVNHMGQFDYYI